MRTDVHGNDLTPAQSHLLDCYDTLVAVLTDHRDELAPFEERGALQALVALWHVADGLDCDPPQLYELGA